VEELAPFRRSMRVHGARRGTGSSRPIRSWGIRSAARARNFRRDAVDRSGYTGVSGGSEPAVDKLEDERTTGHDSGPPVRMTDTREAVSRLY
jgi:hypothetical protein